MQASEIGSRTRVAAAGLCALQALIFGWGAVMLPWTLATVFTVLAGTFAVLSSAVAVTAFVLPARFPLVWRVQAWVGLGVLGYLGWVVVSSIAYMVGVYGSLGRGLSAALLAAFAPALLLTLPSAMWALAATSARAAKGEGVALGVALLFFTGDALRWRMVGQGDTVVTAADVNRFAAGLKAMSTATASAAPSGSLFQVRAARCPKAPVRAVTTFVSAETDTVRQICSAGPDVGAVLVQLRETLATRARGLRAKVDLLVGLQPLDELAPLVPPFVVRPGVDGVCTDDGDETRCMMPWQMVALAQFNAYRPVEFIPDIQLGVDPRALRRHLRVEGPSERSFVGLARLRTASFLRDEAGRWRRYFRGRPERETATPAQIAQAAERAGGFIERAQILDGRFTYKTDPYRGTFDNGSFSVARQAGTTLALCELGKGQRAKVSALRSLAFMSRLYVRAEPREGEPATVGAISWPQGHRPSHLPLGPSALSLVAFLTCRDRMGLTNHDALIGSLGELMLANLLPEGRFAPFFAVKAGGAHDGAFRLYADGQGVYALILLEQLAQTAGVLPRPAEHYAEAAERAMRFYSQTYWQMPARDFFFIEENWHCLAARAALESHRVDSYERFCMDYVRFKARLVFDEHRGVSPDAVGGNHFSNVTYPYNTPTAGFGEAAAAAVAVADRRGEAYAEVKAALRRTLDFLVHAQWRKEVCFACSERIDVAGAFSESLASPIVRIDYVQHAWAALGHGSAALGAL